MLLKLFWLALFSLVYSSLWAKDLPSCLFVSSYHSGYAWADGEARGLHSVLDGKCAITSFSMDTKRNTSATHARQAALQAKALIEKLKPDIIIAADDAAAKYLIVPYYKNTALPIVFCGVNWTVAQYGFPFSNVTGMIEVAAVEPLFQKSSSIIGKISHATYLGADTLTERKILAHYRKVARKLHITLASKLSSTSAAWIESYRQAQTSEVIILGSNAGISDWNETKVLDAIKPYTHALTVTNNSWMMPYTMLGMTKVPEEQGEWAGELALEILKGTKPSDIPIIPNRKYDLIINKRMIALARISIPEFIRLKAQPYYK
jgi:ABC-type uncharacterized transport system substrate-binding protein